MGNQDDREFEVKSRAGVLGQSFEAAVRLVLQSVENPVCEEDGSEAEVTPVPSIVPGSPTPTLPVFATPGWPGSSVPSFSEFDADNLGPYLKGPSLTVVRDGDSKVKLTAGLSPRQVRKQPETCLERAADGVACLRWEQVVDSSPDGYRLSYRYSYYNGVSRVGLGYPQWSALPASGRLEVTVTEPGFWSFEVLQENADGSERLRSGTVTLALGFGDFAKEIMGTPSPSDGSSDPRLTNPPGPPVNRDGSFNLGQPATATPLPTLADGFARPARPVLASAVQDFSAVARVKLSLGSAVDAGTVVEYRYWPHSGFLPDEGIWEWQTVSNWDNSVPGVRRAFYITDAVQWQRTYRLDSSKFIHGVWSFQVRVRKLVNGEMAYSEPSAVRTVFVRAFVPVPTPTATP